MHSTIQDTNRSEEQILLETLESEVEAANTWVGKFEIIFMFTHLNACIQHVITYVQICL
jgi:hypothetical protein